jgi:hypothetical protein
MTHDDAHFLREQAFAYLRGELDATDTRRFEHLLLLDPQAAEFVSRLDDMLRAARVPRPETWTQRDPDTAFDAILADLDAPYMPAAGPTAAPASTSEFGASILPFAPPRDPRAFPAAPPADPGDALFAAITERLDAPTITLIQTPVPAALSAPTPAAAPPAAASNDDLDDAFGPVPPPRRAASGLWLMAAAVLLGVSALIWRLVASDAPPAATPDTAQVAEASAAPESDSALQQIAMVAEGLENVQVFASDDAAWSLSEGPAHVLTLERGTVLVEFVGDGSSSLRVDAPAWDIAVTGTVFFASVDAPGADVGVLVGSVEVVSDSGETTIALQAGRQYDVHTGLSDLNPDDRDRMALRVAPGDHALRLEAARQASAVPQEPGTPGPDADVVASAQPVRERPPAPRPVRPDSGAEVGPRASEDASADAPEEASAPGRDWSALLQEGRAAERSADWNGAVDAYESALGAMPAGAPEAATLRLDLGRIYVRRLDRPERGMFHLRRFLLTSPNDAAAPSVREEFCRFVRENGQTDPLCQP